MTIMHFRHRVLLLIAWATWISTSCVNAQHVPTVPRADTSNRIDQARAALNTVIFGELTTELASHRLGNVYAPELHRDGNLLRLWYGGQGADGHDRIHLAESSDGTSWTKRGVVLDCGNANHVNDPSIVRVNHQWWMYYTVAPTAEDDEIAAAVSDDGIHWNPLGVVVKCGTGLAWDSRKVGRPAVLYEQGMFRLWYDGQPTAAAAEANALAARVRQEGRAVGYARSADGVHFEKCDAPVYHAGAGAVHVLRSGARLLMTGESQQGTWWATSHDGQVWQSRGTLLGISGAADDRYGHVTPCLAQDGESLYLFVGAASRSTWDGNRIARVALSPSMFNVND